MRAAPGPIVLFAGLCLFAPVALAQAPEAPAAPDAAATAPAVTVEVTAETDANLSQYSGRLRELVSRYANAAPPPSAAGEARVRFRIRRDGIAQKPILSLSSGRPPLDEAALAAVSEALRHAEPLPASVTGIGLDFQARFVYGPTERVEEQPASLAEVARQRAARKKQDAADAAAKKVYTNETVSGSDASARSNPRSRSEEASDEKSAPSTTSTSKSKTTGETATPQEQDPEYYRSRLNPLRAELNEVKSELDRIRYAPAERTAGLNTISNTQQNQIERLQRKQADLEKRIAAIEAEAARNNVSIY